MFFFHHAKQIAAVLLFRSISRQSRAAERRFTAIPRIAVSDLAGDFAGQFHGALRRIRHHSAPGGSTKASFLTQFFDKRSDRRWQRTRELTAVSDDLARVCRGYVRKLGACGKDNAVEPRIEIAHHGCEHKLIVEIDTSPCAFHQGCGTESARRLRCESVPRNRADILQPFILDRKRDHGKAFVYRKHGMLFRVGKNRHRHAVEYAGCAYYHVKVSERYRVKASRDQRVFCRKFHFRFPASERKRSPFIWHCAAHGANQPFCILGSSRVILVMPYAFDLRISKAEARESSAPKTPL